MSVKMLILFGKEKNIIFIILYFNYLMTIINISKIFFIKNLRMVMKLFYICLHNIFNYLPQNKTNIKIN
jgi:hypothetical protein